MTATLAVPVILGLLAQAQPPAPRAPAEGPEARLAYMKKSISGYEIRPADGPTVTYQLRPEPVMRFVNTVGASRDGAIFLWLGGDGRPEAAAQIMVLRGGAWVHELTSLATGPVVAKNPGLPDWSPAEGGAAFRPIPGAPRPAETAEQRLVQMRALTREFHVEDHFRGASWQTLRLLSKPYARYGKAGTAVNDGALFCYVLTTDPEAYLMIEARRGGEGPVWQYAFAPMTVYPLRASLRGKKVWEVGYRWGNPPTATFHNRELPTDPDAPREPEAAR